MPPCSHFSTPHGSRSVFRCLHIPGLRCFHQAGSGSTNGYGQGRGGTTKDAGSQGTTKHTKKTQEPRMDTNGYGQGGGTTNGHEWTRMTKTGVNHETHEIHEKNSEPRMETNGHEWIEPRMDTNGHEWPWAGVNHETHEIHEKTQEPLMDTNGHLEGDKGNKEKHRRCCVHVQILWQYK